MCKEPKTEKRTIHVDIALDAYEIMEKLRGSLTHDAFLELVLRMIDSNAVTRPPE